MVIVGDGMIGKVIQLALERAVPSSAPEQLLFQTCLVERFSKEGDAANMQEDTCESTVVLEDTIMWVRVGPQS